MCGLAGWIGSSPSVIDEAAILEALRHRGPDGVGKRAWPDAALLHTRLKIIDLSPTGAEPMANEDESVFIVFNGEIYNHRELRRDLEGRGHVFRGSCDAEVLPHLYEEHGSDLFARLRGMFSVAIYDVRGRRLLLARDRFGIKPLFYAQSKALLAFASELNALRNVPGIDFSPDAQAISDFASLLYVPAPRTIFRGVQALEPGTVLEAELASTGDVATTTRPYHRWSVEPRQGLTLDEAIEEADALVDAAVGRQLESDVPLGALLSGGIDSSLVSAAAQRRSSDVLQTFNVGFPEAAYDETAAARAVASHIHSKHETLEMPGRGGSWDRVTRLLRHAGQPFADTSLFAVDAITEAMRRHVTVALSGDGGDEGFGGYDHYRKLAAAERLRRLPAVSLGAASRAASLGAKAGVVRPTLSGRLNELRGADDTALLEGFFTWVRGDEHRRLVIGSAGLDPPRRLFERRWHGDAGSAVDRLVAHAVEVDIRLVLANDFLFKVDTASMRHSLEVRVPMLDEDLMRFALTLPSALRANRREGKIVLRGIGERRLPEAVVRRRKQGFAVPVDTWVDDEFKANLRATLLDPSSRVQQHLDRDVYEPWVRAFCGEIAFDGLGRRALYPRVTMLLALELALQHSP